MRPDEKLRRLHLGAVGVFALWLVLLPSAPSPLPLLGFVGFMALSVWTFAAMYSFSKQKLGRAYARKNLALAIGFTLVFGLGVIVWPPLVLTEAKKITRLSPPVRTRLA